MKTITNNNFIHLFSLSLFGLVCTLEAAIIIFSSHGKSHVKGVVDGVEDCGSMGNVYQVRVEGCDLLPCQLMPGNSYVIEIDFSTSTSGDLWNVIVTGIAGNNSVIVLDETVEASISPGERHTLQYELPVTSLFEGLDIKVKVELIEDSNRTPEVCISADAHVNFFPTTTTEPTTTTGIPSTPLPKII